jgi:hypothetical protein
MKKLFNVSAISEGFVNSTPFTTIQSTLLDFKIIVLALKIYQESARHNIRRICQVSRDIRFSELLFKISFLLCGRKKFFIQIWNKKTTNFQCWGSGSVFVGVSTICFKTSRIRFRLWILLSSSKKSKKNLHSSCFVTSL